MRKVFSPSRKAKTNGKFLLYFSSGEGILPISFIHQKQQPKPEREQRNQQKEIILDSTPELVQGINLIQSPDKIPIFQALLAEEMLGNNKTAVWIDSKNKSSTYALSSYGSPEMLERVKIGRAFTPYQHHTLVDKFNSGSIEADILIVSDINHLYDKEDAEDIFRDMLQKVAELEGLKVLVSVSGKTSLSASVFGMEENRIEVEVTGQGWKYDSEDYDQLVYRDGQSLQTTMPLWHQKAEKTKPVKARTV